jgi:hypothetical protein
MTKKRLGDGLDVARILCAGEREKRGLTARDAGVGLRLAFVRIPPRALSAREE